MELWERVLLCLLELPVATGSRLTLGHLKCLIKVLCLAIAGSVSQPSAHEAWRRTIVHITKSAREAFDLVLMCR